MIYLTFLFVLLNLREYSAALRCVLQVALRTFLTDSSYLWLHFFPLRETHFSQCQAFCDSMEVFYWSLKAVVPVRLSAWFNYSLWGIFLGYRPGGILLKYALSNDLISICMLSRMTTSGSTLPSVQEWLSLISHELLAIPFLLRSVVLARV